jgi:hypothetical protein
MVTEGDGKINDTFQKTALSSLKVPFFGICDSDQWKKKKKEICARVYFNIKHISLKYVTIFYYKRGHSAFS